MVAYFEGHAILRIRIFQNAMVDILILQSIFYIVLILAIVIVATLLAINLYHLVDVVRRVKQMSIRIARLAVRGGGEAGRKTKIKENREGWVSVFLDVLAFFKSGRVKKVKKQK